MSAGGFVRELRLVLTVDDLDSALSFYRDGLGFDEVASFENDGGRGFLLDVGHASLELFDEAQAEAVDLLEVGRRVAGPVRLAFRVDDTDEAAARLADHGARPEAAAVNTDWGSRNVRLLAPTAMQLTLFSLGGGD
jgi:catechol 2,3-dioxygenase-like lactoylglutathione lyase family enzyme